MEKVEIEPAKQEYRDLLEVAQKVSAWITDEERMKYFQEQAKAFYDDFVKWEEQEQTPYPLDWLVLPYATYLDAHIGSLISDGKPKKLSIPFDKEKSLRADYVLLTIIHDKRLKNPRTPLISHGIWSEDEEWVVEKWEEISDGYARGSRDIQAHFNSAIKRVEKDLPDKPAETKLENEPQEKGGQSKKTRRPKRRRKTPPEILKEVRERKAAKELAENPNVTCIELAKILECHKSTVVRLKAWINRKVLSSELPEGIVTHQEDDSYSIDGIARTEPED
ncbi:MAG: hypothetical protein ISS76_16445 [Phycisphaerae bacterium]|nr:hypothetical protein [Phycisphaerae bacterium]